MNPPLDPRRIELLDPAIVAILKTKTPAEKLAMVFDAHQFAFDVQCCQIRAAHPEWSISDVRDAVVRRLSRGSR